LKLFAVWHDKSHAPTDTARITTKFSKLPVFTAANSCYFGTSNVESLPNTFFTARICTKAGNSSPSSESISSNHRLHTARPEHSPHHYFWWNWTFYRIICASCEKQLRNQFRPSTEATRLFHNVIFNHLLPRGWLYVCTNRFNIKQEAQCAYIVTLWSVRATTAAVKNSYYIFYVYVCSLYYSACKAHAPYCHLWPVRLLNIFPHYLINGTIFGGRGGILNGKHVFWFSLRNRDICHSKNWARSHHKCTLVFMWSTR
jgi:hypothetical protein